MVKPTAASESLEQSTVDGSTLHAKDVLLLYREPGVLTGYIPSNKPWTYYIYATLTLNNETVNIWTHAAGFVIMLYNLYVYITKYRIGEDPVLTPLIGFGICSLLNTFLSCVAHTFHFKSPFIHYTAYQADYAGIGFYSLGCGMLSFYFSCRHDWYIYLADNFMLINFVISWFGFLCSSIAKLLYRRPYPLRRKLWNIGSFGVQGTLLYSIIFSRLMDDSSFTTMYDHITLTLLLLATAFFFSSHLPEKFWPGKFDIIGQGHHVFHVMSVVLAVKHLSTSYKDSIEYSRGPEALRPSLGFLLFYITMFGVACSVTVLAMRPFVKRRIRGDMQHEQ